ncbi:hypothetical protein KCP71_15815 [Salmonella enterica subsp. enterica]|nr:hypothetical protein KCP71_15815 [Salmonella enterica subsp. enterica]
MVCNETGQAFRDRRAVCGNSGRYSCSGMGSGADAPRRGIIASTHIVDIRQTPDDVTVFDERGNAGRRIFSWAATALNRSCGKVYSATRRA